jgi:hypothetical protein
MQDTASALNTWPMGHMYFMLSPQQSCSKHSKWPYQLPGCVCVRLKQLKISLIIGQRDSKRFAITPVWTLQLLHYIGSDRKRQYILNLCFAGGSDNYCKMLAARALFLLVCLPTHHLYMASHSTSTGLSTLLKPQHLYRSVHITQDTVPLQVCPHYSRLKLPLMFLYNTWEFH